MITKQLYFKIATVLCIFMFLSCAKEEDKDKCSFVGYGVITDKFSKLESNNGDDYKVYYAVINNDTIREPEIICRKLVKGNTVLYKEECKKGDLLLIFKDWNGCNFYASISEEANKNAVIDYQVRSRMFNWCNVIFTFVGIIITVFFVRIFIIFDYGDNKRNSVVAAILCLILFIILFWFAAHFSTSQMEKWNNMPIVISSE